MRWGLLVRREVSLVGVSLPEGGLQLQLQLQLYQHAISPRLVHGTVKCSCRSWVAELRADASQAAGGAGWRTLWIRLNAKSPTQLRDMARRLGADQLADDHPSSSEHDRCSLRDGLHKWIKGDCKDDDGGGGHPSVRMAMAGTSTGTSTGTFGGFLEVVKRQAGPELHINGNQWSGTTLSRYIDMKTFSSKLATNETLTSLTQTRTNHRTAAAGRSTVDEYCASIARHPRAQDPGRGRVCNC